MTSTHFNLAEAEADANARLRDYISRAAGQHRRAIKTSFAEARDLLESRARHQLALALAQSRSHANLGAHS